jgi:type I restriction-modification system DNA methylase subunit
MTDAEKREAARQFCQKWAGRGREDEDDRSYWLDILIRVLGIEDATDRIEFQKKVIVDGNTKRIDAYIPETRVIIEQKTLGIPLDKKGHQSGGIELTPYEQAKRYNDNLPYEEKARWIVTSNFSEIWIYDMNTRVPAPVKLSLEDLQSKYSVLDFLINQKQTHITEEMEISVKAGELVGIIYDALYKQYINPESERAQKSLNMLCVRLVFCLYAEDAGIFNGNRSMFHDYLQPFDAKDIRKALIELFKTLDTKPEDRDPYDMSDLAKFPYVNGGLFADENIEIPHFTDEIKNILLANASDGFDWSAISPTIFGAVFESTLNPETRRSGGMHYTSIENIHKVIDPLFLDDLRSELDEIKTIQVERTKAAKLKAFQNKLGGVKWLDPACGSGNFLTETYISVRRLENEVLMELQHGQIVFGEAVNPIQVSISQFYGIEINDFAVTVAKTALWIAESQMMKETEDIVHSNLDFLPLKTNAYIVEGNALEIDWKDVVSPSELDYIMGNPPFVGGMYMNEFQKNETRNIFYGIKGAGEMDYVCGWYKKASEYILGTSIKVAFVSTNSICQGSQVITFWKYIIESYSIHIDFAYKTFVWNNEAKGQARVHCVIVGFSGINTLSDNATKKLYSDISNYKICEHISPYLTDNEVCFIESRSTPICDVPQIRFGSMPRDGGGFILTPEERDELIKTDPLSEKWIKPYIGAEEFLKNKKRYCLWLVGAEPSELKKCTNVMKRVEFVRDTRLNSKAAGTRKFAATPTLFCQIAQPDTDYIIVPKTSSGKRRYIPLGFMDKNTIASDLVFLIPNAGLYEFGVLMSNVHNSWMRLVAGRLKSDYRYAKDIVYNNFPWCTPTDEQRSHIEKTAQGILDARALYPTSSLADLYDPLTMPPELQKAHTANDKAVMQAYGFSIKDTTEADCVAALMKMYQELTK